MAVSSIKYENKEIMEKDIVSKETDFTLLDEQEITELDVEELEEVDLLGEFTEKLFEGELSSNLPMFLRLTRRGVVFFFLVLVSLFTLFIIGNKQQFLDSDLNIILIAMTCDAILLTFMSIAAIFESIVCIFMEKKIKYFFHFIAFFIPLALAIVFGFLSRSITLLTEGFFN